MLDILQHRNSKYISKGNVISDTKIKSYNSVATSLAALVSLHVKKRCPLSLTVKANISEYKKGLMRKIADLRHNGLYEMRDGKAAATVCYIFSSDLSYIRKCLL